MIRHQSPPKQQTHPHDYGYRKCNSLSLVVESKPQTLLLLPLFTQVTHDPWRDTPKP
jgi:hypothetical protein